MDAGGSSFSAFPMPGSSHIALFKTVSECTGVLALFILLWELTDQHSRVPEMNSASTQVDVCYLMFHQAIIT